MERWRLVSYFLSNSYHTWLTACGGEINVIGQLFFFTTENTTAATILKNRAFSFYEIEARFQLFQKVFSPSIILSFFLVCERFSVWKSKWGKGCNGLWEWEQFMWVNWGFFVSAIVMYCMLEKIKEYVPCSVDAAEQAHQPCCVATKLNSRTKEKLIVKLCVHYP